jgi:protein-S-isoprenylcysteine O-methyltransferase Ste14
MDFVIRKDKTAKSVERTKDDNKSTIFILLTFFVVLVLSAVLNFFELGIFKNIQVARIGILIMLLGISIRIISMLTLSKFYTRTLITVNNQELVKKGIYRIIRHPGYLGTILIWGFAGLAMQNFIIFLVAIILVLTAYYYRIVNEEKMLLTTFGNKYLEYKKQSWRLLPFIW